jgi:ABC-type multidrug transport system fused ATPase/permease subunit
MRSLPLADPGVADTRSPGRYLFWVARGQTATVLGGIGFGIVWFVAQALMPAIIGRAIDAGVAANDTSALLLWAGALLTAGVVQAVAGVARHRWAVANWLTAAFRTIQIVARHSVYVGATLPKRVATGEVVAIGASDLAHIGNAIEVSGRGAGAVVSFLVVALLLLNTSMTLGLVVLIGVPLLLLAIGPLLKPLQTRNLAQREMMGELTTLASDIVGGLRVLRGIGGEEVFHNRYVTESQRVRRAGVKVGRLQSLLDALQILLPGIFVVVVVWLGARFAVQGAVSPGELVAFYGYAAFLMMPLRTATEVANKVIRGLVASRRVCRILVLEPEITSPEHPVTVPERGELVDRQSGLVVPPGQLTAVVSEIPEETAALADRLGRYADADVSFGGVQLREMDKDVLRRKIVVSDAGSTLFSGRLHDELDITDAFLGGQDETALLTALHTASAEDVVEALPEGLESTVEERGRSFSGGERQRLVLTRTLAADPEVLVLVEPTSAVDAHTEARIAERLRGRREGRTTVVMTSSPLLLDRADRVAFVHQGRVVAEGSHRELLSDEPRYRRVVTRGEEDE